MDRVLKKLAQEKSFTKNQFIQAYKDVNPLNLSDPMWRFVVEEQIVQYLKSGAIVEKSQLEFELTPRAKSVLEESEDYLEELKAHG